MKYVALVRGMGPGDPKFNNQTICVCLENLGFAHVSSLLTSGNYIFESDNTQPADLEQMIEQSIKERIGYDRVVIVRNHQQIQKLIEFAPFGDQIHSRRTYTLVTFLKNVPEIKDASVFRDTDGLFKVTMFDKELGVICAVSDQSTTKTPDVMRWLEKHFGKDNISSRTWNTTLKIYNKMI